MKNYTKSSIIARYNKMKFVIFFRFILCCCKSVVLKLSRVVQLKLHVFVYLSDMIIVERTYENYSNMTFIHLILYNIFKRKSNTIWKLDTDKMIVTYFKPNTLTTKYKIYCTAFIRMLCSLFRKPLS